ncbi:MAG: tetratricopeptide repeat protein [Planctomycetota bacterium]|nr:tetratricopeptide repeat protein [Planctomycetota bacterium]
MARAETKRGGVTRRLACHRWLLALALPVVGLTGCSITDKWDDLPLVGFPKVPLPAAESGMVGPDGVIESPPHDPKSPEGRLAGGREYFRQGEYSKAEAIFHRLYRNQKNPLPVLEEARYYEAECLRLQGHYPKAADTYVDLLNKFDRTQYKEQAVQHMYDIANYWLDDTRTQMAQEREKKEGKRWFVTPAFITLERSKPFMDREGRAIEKLEQVRYHDINGPLADKALFMCGCVKFFRTDYIEADYFFSQIHERHPNSDLAPQSVELAIISKHLSTGGADYDGRKVAEARLLVHSAFTNYPELADKKDFLTRQLVGITMQQAEKDFKVAEFYERTKHPSSAFFYYELVRRRYPGTPYGEEAKIRMADLRQKHPDGVQPEVARLPVKTLPEVKWPWKRKDADDAAPAEVGPAPRQLPAGLLPPGSSPSGGGSSGNYLP